MLASTRLSQLPSGVREMLATHPRALCRRSAIIPTQKRNITIDQLNSGRDSKSHNLHPKKSSQIPNFSLQTNTHPPSPDRERVVILGSGWAGFTVARSLDPSKFQAVVVSPRSYFAFTPLLASTAVGTLEFRTALEPVRSRRTKVDFFQGWADDVDFKNKTITIEEAVDDPLQGMALTTDRHAGETKEQREEVKAKEKEKGRMFDLTYDKLVVSVGCYSQTFETPGVREHAHFLKDVGDARKIRNRLLACFEGAALPTTSDEMRRQLLNFAVVGGGPTGIEFSAELHDLINEDMRKIYPELIPFHKITVYDVAEKVLPMFDEKLANYAMKKFKREGINIKTSHHVEELRPGAPAERSASQDSNDYHLYTLKVKEEGEIGVGMCVWSKSPHPSRLYHIFMYTNTSVPTGTGLMQNPFVAHALSNVRSAPSNLILNSPTPSAPTQWKVQKDAKSGSIITDAALRIKLVPQDSKDADNVTAIHPDVFALGDCGIIQSTTYPATAQVASQKAAWLAKHLNANTISSSTFTYKDLGTLAYIGNWDALFQGGKGGRLQGYLAWIIWRGAYITKTVSWRNKILVPVYWCVNWIFGRDISRF
jgi:NADH dehydrogenase FAD-containing subunit